VKVDFLSHGKPEKAIDMNQALMTHKETKFRRMLLIQARAAACKASLARTAREQAARAVREAEATPRRYLAPR
jgi:hypothetical protein